MISNVNNNLPSILAVDDNPNNLEVLGGFLQKEGMEVEFAMDGKTALNWLEIKAFDLILLDVMMPEMDGFEVCTIIKKNPAYRKIPIIFITAKTDSESIIKGFEIGAVDYITKPFIKSELLARAKTQIHIRKANERIMMYLNSIESQNRNIKNSIEYALNIQRAVLRTASSDIGAYPENFILYLPKDIVSGDFYWYYEINDTFILAVMDCTGHGVPGAFMSILGITLLNEIVIHNGIVNPDEILERLREELINTLGQGKGQGQGQNIMNVKDGMDGSIINYDKRSGILKFSGAFNPMFHLHDNTINKINADRNPVGYFENVRKFTLKTIRIQKGDIIYLFSDGYMDQFGGPDRKKIMKCRFIDHLMEIYKFTMDNQRAELLDFLNRWKGGMEQTDDILVVGLRF